MPGNSVSRFIYTKMRHYSNLKFQNIHSHYNWSIITALAATNDWQRINAEIVDDKMETKNR
jgi:hypothetical protein